ncbi:hypothetical protein D3C85_1828070 [compost metagenome]
MRDRGHSLTQFLQTIGTTFGDAVLDQAVRATFGDAVLDQAVRATFSHAILLQPVRTALCQQRLDLAV